MNAVSISNSDSSNKKSNNILNEEANRLIIENVQSGRKLAWKLLKSWNVRLPEEEVESIVGIALCEAAKNFDADAGARFQTFFYYHLRGRLIKEITEVVQNKNGLSDYTQLEYSDVLDAGDDMTIYHNDGKFSSQSPERILVNKEQQINFENAFQKLDTLEKEIITRHYFNGESLIDLAAQLNYCRCHMSRVKSKAISNLRKLLLMSEDGSSDSNKEQKNNYLYKGGRGRKKLLHNKVKKSLNLQSDISMRVMEAVNA